MGKQVINTFIGGMNKDIDKALISNKQYLDAHNYRLITTKGSSTGSLETIKGNNVIELVELISDGQFIIGSSEIRNRIVLFTTSNVTESPETEGGRSQIYVLEIDLDTESQTSLTLIYDDYLNEGLDVSDFLNFSTAYPIKTISRYETPNVQKIYWTDGYNNIRYVNISRESTITGEPYSSNDYMNTTMFEFLPLFSPSRPVLSNIVSGTIPTGVVQYSYQLYKNNGAETAFSPASNVIHIVSDSDFLVNTRGYHGNETSINSGKGVVLSIDNEKNSDYDRLRLIRIFYSTLHALPVITIASEIAIPSTGSVIKVIDIGNTVGELTIDEFNIASTELFKCQDIAVKDNILFAANIEQVDYDLDFDCRAVRFKNASNVEIQNLNTISGAINIEDTIGGCTIDGFTHNNKLYVSVTNLSSYVPVGHQITDVTGVILNGSGVTIADGEYSQNTGPTYDVSYIIIDTNFNVTNISYSPFDNGTLVFVINDLTGAIFSDFLQMETSTSPLGQANFINSRVYGLQFEYNYDIEVVIPGGITASLEDSDPVNNIELNDVSEIEWAQYIETHDGINTYNDTDNDGDLSHAYKYQADGQTLGAEGPNIKIEFETIPMLLDNSNSGYTFYVNSPESSSNPSYKNYASPFKSGEISWQRDEVYRLFVVFGNERGQKTFPKWICDLRMPSLHDSSYTNSSGATVIPYGLATHQIFTFDINTNVLRPRIYFKSFPEGASWAQIHRVERSRADRFVVTQGFVIPSIMGGGVYRPDIANKPVQSSGNIIKIVSPEININKNINQSANDYLEFVTYFGLSGSLTSKDAIIGDIHKMRTNIRVPFSTNTITNIDAAKLIAPDSSASENTTIGTNVISSLYYSNYNMNVKSQGCSGLLTLYSNSNWSAKTLSCVVVNYKSNVFNSQYGGNTYETRLSNISIPCSSIIYSDDIEKWISVKQGDTFINFFDCRSLLADLSVADISLVWPETIYVPLESSINCDLRHDIESRHNFPQVSIQSVLIQEYAGEHTVPMAHTTYTFNQTRDLYLYNTVYSQQGTSQYAVGKLFDSSNETKFDCMIKASNEKFNGELSDSWTKFGINEFIEVDSVNGPVNAIFNFNDRLVFFQDRGVGLLAVNDRSLINDNASAQLVLGTGGVLDRYDYVTNHAGCMDKFSISSTKSGLYWYDRLIRSIYRYAESLTDLTRSKFMKSYFDNSTVFTNTSIYRALSHPDIKNDEVLFTFFKESSNNGFTLSFSELIDAFVSFHDFVPSIYIPYKHRFLTTTSSFYCGGDFDRNHIFLHDSNIEDRCSFWKTVDDKHVPSTITILFNPEYESTKVFDNLFYVGNTYSDTAEIFSKTFSSMRCYNDFQNTSTITLIPGTNVERRERYWTLVVPRSAVDVDVSDDPNISTELDTSQLFKERMRDTHLIVYLVYTNDGTYDRFIFSNLGLRYRNSLR